MEVKESCEMHTQVVDSDMFDCKKLSIEQLINMLKSMRNEISIFDSQFTAFVEEQKQLAHSLWNNVTRYNILDGNLPQAFPSAQKELLLEELLGKIQEQTSSIKRSLADIKEKYSTLPKLNNALEHQSDQTDWNPVTNFSIKGTISHKPPSEYLEDIADILYNYDIALTCMHDYFDALDIHNPSTYQNLMNSFSIFKQFSELVNEFKINTLTLFD